jgi:rhodanese-related sulfurtransferase
MRTLVFISFIMFSFLSSAQSKEFKIVIDSYLSFKADTIHVSQLKQKSSLVYVDCRDIKEFEVSKIQGAIFHENFDWKNHQDKTIVVYCSIGKRSEDLSIELNEAGAKNVFNLYGGIFEWVNQGNSVYNQEGVETNKVHTYSEKWSKWLVKGKAIY